MHFSDIFKKSFLEGMSSSDLSLRSILITIAIACIFALYIFVAYKVVTRKTFYDKSFNISLAMITVIVASIIITIQSSLVVSLGMVGALSIVRFRTAIKSPIDLVFMFWSIANGIICGAGLPGIALIASLALTAGCIILNELPANRTPMILIVNADNCKAKSEIIRIVSENVVYHTVKSESISNGVLNLVVEVKMKKETDIVDKISAIDGITRCSLINHSGEVTY